MRNFGAITREILQLEAARERLVREAAETDSFAKLSGQEAKAWLIEHGMTESEATGLIVDIIRRRLRVVIAAARAERVEPSR